MDRPISKPTCAQLEELLAEKIYAFYRQQLESKPAKISCQLFNEKLAIVIEDSLTSSEKLLLNNGQKELAKRLHSDLEKAMQSQIKGIIEEIMQVPVIDLLSDATLETGRTGTIAILAAAPPACHAFASFQE